MRSFSARLTAWQKRHGRHDLPWQRTRDAYAIWLSEIMLQQTQVATVIPYYERFLRRFPSVHALAGASLDEVLALWSGLGYYSRARNLHKAARMVVETHGGVIPEDPDAVRALPGVGRSTAAAIGVFAHGGRHAILDGNVKRVLARHGGVRGYPGEVRVQEKLWRMAEALLPTRHIASYTQGLMDLGAGVCLRKKPRCESCPVNADCVARAKNLTEQLPGSKVRRARPHRKTAMLLLRQGDGILLEKRPLRGIWGGLWSFPEADHASDLGALRRLCRQRYGVMVRSARTLSPLEHGFTHFDLTISPVLLRVTKIRAAESDLPDTRWLTRADAASAGLPAPVRKILLTYSF